MEQWLDSESADKVRLYECSLVGGSNQIGFSVKVLAGETPVGKRENTYVQFLYNSTTNGLYELLWFWSGRQNGEYLRLGDTPRTVWLRANKIANRDGIPSLEIVAFEGLEPYGVIIAQPGRKK